MQDHTTNLTALPQAEEDTGSQRRLVNGEEMIDNLGSSVD